SAGSLYVEFAACTRENSPDLACNKRYIRAASLSTPVRLPGDGTDWHESVLTGRACVESCCKAGMEKINCNSRYYLLSEFRDDVMRSWLLLQHRVPTEPSAGRVAIWRKMKRLGAFLLQDAT